MIQASSYPKPKKIPFMPNHLNSILDNAFWFRFYLNIGLIIYIFTTTNATVILPRRKCAVFNVFKIILLWCFLQVRALFFVFSESCFMNKYVLNWWKGLIIYVLPKRATVMRLYRASIYMVYVFFTDECDLNHLRFTQANSGCWM